MRRRGALLLLCFLAPAAARRLSPSTTSAASFTSSAMSSGTTTTTTSVAAASSSMRRSGSSSGSSSSRRRRSCIADGVAATKRVRLTSLASSSASGSRSTKGDGFLGELYKTEGKSERPLRVLFVGHNPSEAAWKAGHYFANKSNRWVRVHVNLHSQQLIVHHPLRFLIPTDSGPCCARRR